MTGLANIKIPNTRAKMPIIKYIHQCFTGSNARSYKSNVFIIVVFELKTRYLSLCSNVNYF